MLSGCRMCRMCVGYVVIGDCTGVFRLDSAGWVVRMQAEAEMETEMNSKCTTKQTEQ